MCIDDVLHVSDFDGFGSLKRGHVALISSGETDLIFAFRFVVEM